MVAELPKIDYDRIDFPSDRLTLKHLRSLKPLAGEYAHGPDFDFLAYADELISMHGQERLFAELGFVAALGDASNSDAARRKLIDRGDELECREDLANLYTRYGVSDGIESARQLIRRLEDQGAAQAKQLVGRGAGGGS